MNCNRAQQALLLETSGEIGSWRAHRLHRHLAACPVCRQWQADLSRLSAIELAPRATPELNPAQFQPLAIPRRASLPFVVFPAWAAALVILLAGAGWWSWSQWTVRQSEMKALTRMERLQEWTLLAALMNGDDLTGWDSNDPANPETARQALARQLLRLQEADGDEMVVEEGIIPSAQHPPTTLPRHNSFAGPFEKYG
jgi:hypothetical protein